MKPQPKIKDVIHAACEVHGVTPEYLRSDTRNGDVVFLRQITHYVARKLTRGTLKMIAKQTGRTSHATVLHSYKKVYWEYGKYEDISSLVDDIYAYLEKRGFSTEDSHKPPYWIYLNH